MNNWKNVDKIFVGRAFGAADVNDELITKDLLKALNCPIDSFTLCVQKPCDNIELMGIPSPLAYIEQLIFNEDGSMTREYLYNRYPKDVIRTKINEHPALTPWGQSIFDNAIEEIKMQKIQDSEKW